MALKIASLNFLAEFHLHVNSLLRGYVKKKLLVNFVALQNVQVQASHRHVQPLKAACHPPATRRNDKHTVSFSSSAAAT